MEKKIARQLGITDPALLERLLAHGHEERVKRGQLLLRCGEERQYLYFLIYGLFRGFVVDREGNEVTDCFVAEPGEPIVDCGPLDETPKVSIEAMEASRVYAIPIQDVLEALGESQELLVRYNQLLLQALDHHWQMKILLLRASTFERYQWFLRTTPELMHRVSHKYIASYLGMTPVTLSRLRQQCRELTGSVEGVVDEDE